MWKELKKALLGKNTEEMMKEFAEVFPGKCIVCAYHSFGIREGFLPPASMVQEHDCIEAHEEVSEEISK